jgi:copper chaperone CopZ
VLAQPLIVEALEDNFIPVAIYNNTGGKDKQILTQFNEPAWNYQVMRFLNSDLTDIVPRKDKVWTINATANRLAHALKANKKDVPGYLKNILIPESNQNNKIAVFAMYCFWTGEAKLGSLDGVIETEAGFFDGKEVVVVKYDDRKIKLIDLVSEAEKFDCAHAVYLPTEQDQQLIAQQTDLKNTKLFSFKHGYRMAPASDQKRQLSQTKGLKALGLTPMQWTKLNSLGISKQPYEQWLSPQQLEKFKTAN